MKRSSLIVMAVAGAIAATVGITYFILRSRQPAPVVPQVIINQPAQEVPKVEQTIVVQSKTPEEQLIQQAKDMLHKNERIEYNNMIVRDLLPDDVGITSTWSVSVTGPAWTTIANTDIGHNKVVVLTGALYSGTNITQVKISRAASILDLWNLEGTSYYTTAPVYTDVSPNFFNEDDPIKIEVYAKTSGTEILPLRGFVVEEEGISVVK